MQLHVETGWRNPSWVAAAILPSKILAQIREQSDVKMEVRASGGPQTSLSPQRDEARTVGKEGFAEAAAPSMCSPHN